MSADRGPIDPALDRLLRRHSSATPSRAIDDAILAAAHRAVDSGPRRDRGWRAWSVWMPVAAAATIAFVIVGVAPPVPPIEDAPVAVDSRTPARAKTATPAPQSPPNDLAKAGSAETDARAAQKSIPAPAASPPPTDVSASPKVRAPAAPEPGTQAAPEHRTQAAPEPGTQAAPSVSTPRPSAKREAERPPDRFVSPPANEARTMLPRMQQLPQAPPVPLQRSESPPVESPRI
jgi:hypothetical protein